MMQHLQKRNRITTGMHIALMIVSGMMLHTNVSAQTPVITSVSTLTATPGSVLTITGTNFHTTASSNIVYFGATQATASASSTTSVTVTVPAGATYGPIVLKTLTSNLMGYSPYYFVPRYNNSGYANNTVNFAGPTQLSARLRSMQPIIADFDGDGKSDIGFTNYSSDTVVVYRNTNSTGSITSGGFGTPIYVSTGSKPTGLHVCDVDRDGKLDMVCANNNAKTFTVLRNTTSGSSLAFTSGYTSGVLSGNTRQIATGDIDKDGRPDLVVAQSTGELYAVRNNSSPASFSFGTPALITLPSAVQEVRMADLNSDGKTDIVGTMPGNNSIFILGNNASIGFVTTASFTASVNIAATGATNVEVADIDGDGKHDIIVGRGSTISILRNTGTTGTITASTFETMVDFSVGSAITGLAIADVNGDGKADIVGANATNCFVLLNTATSGSITSSSLATYVNFSAGSNNAMLAAGDIDGDGKPDMVIANDLNSYSNVLNILRNDPLSPITGASSVCSGSTTILSTSSTGGSWSSSNTSVATVSGGIVSGSMAGTANISYCGTAGTAYANNCVVTTIAVNTTPAVTVTATPGTICSGSSSTLTASGADNFSWIPVAGLSAVTGATVTATVPTTTTYTITGTNSSGCSGTTTKTLNVIPSYSITASAGSHGSISPSGTTIVCEGGSQAYTITPDSGYLVANVLVDGSGVGTVTTYTFSEISSSHTISVAFVLDCTAPANTASPTVTNILCNGNNTGAVTPHVSGTAPLTWAWSNSATSASLTNVMAGTYTYTVSNGCGSVTGTATVTQPATALSVSRTITDVDCYGNATGSVAVSASGGTSPYSGTGTFTGLSAGSFSYPVTDANGCTANATGSVSQPAAALVAVATATDAHCNGESNGSILVSATGGTTAYTGTGNFTGLAAGTYSFTVTDARGCTSTVADTVYQPAAVNVDVTTSAYTVCNGTSATLTATGATTYAWSGSSLSATTGATVTASPTTPSGIAINVYTVTGYDGSGCASTSDTVSVTVLFMGAISGPTNICNGSSVTLTNTTTGGTWSSANTNVSVSGTSGVVTGTGVGSAIITYTLASGCTRTTTVTVTSSPDPISGIATVCPGSGLSLMPGNPTGGTWSLSNANMYAVVGSNGVATVYGVTAGTTNVSYILPSGCYSYKTFTVAPLAAISGPTTVCTGNSIQLVHPLSGAQWSVNMPTLASINISTGVLSGTAASAVTVTYKVNPSCYVTYNVTVNTSPSSVAGPSSVCTSSSVTLTNPTSGGTWVSDNATAATVGSTSGVVTGMAVGSATISYVMPNGCFRAQAVTVNQTPASITGSSNICATKTSAYTIATTGGSWYSSASNVTIGVGTGIATGVATGTANISYTLSTGCYSVKPVTVTAMPAAITGTTSMCQGTSTTLSSTTPSLTWSSTDETVATVTAASTTTGTVSGLLAGTSTISYTSAAGCTQTINVLVYPLPGTIGGNATVCVGATTTYTNSVTGGTWASSSTSVASVGSSTGVVTGIGAGNYTLTYTTPGGCKTTRTLSVDAQPAAITGTTSLCVGGNTSLASTTTGGTWSTASATASIGSASGIVTGLSTGNAVISYVNAQGCVRTTTVTVTTGLPLIAGPSTMCVGGSYTLTDATTGGTWVSSNTAAATIAAGTGLITGSATGNTTITYRTSPTCHTTKDITIQNAPAAITAPSASVCIASTLQLTHGATGGTWSSSTPANASVNSTSGLVSGVAVGSTTISYAPTPGCLTTISISVNAQPATLTGTFTVCQNNSTVLNSVTSGGVWSSSNTDIATAVTATTTSGTITGGTLAGVATISYTNAQGCSRTAQVTVNTAVPDITGYDLVCVGNNTTLTNTTSGGTWSSSTTAKGSISTIGVVTGIATGTTVITYKTSATCFATKAMSVNGAVAAITGTTSVCKDNTVTLACATSGGTWTSSNANAGATADTSGVITGLAAGTSVITYQVTGSGCYKTATVTVLASPAPIDGTLTIATGTSTTLTNTVSGGTWSSSASTIASIGTTSGIMNGVNVGTANITYKLTNGCYKTAVANITTVAGKAVAGTRTETGQAEIRIFPNPSQGSITVETEVDGVFTIHTMDGKQVARFDISAPTTSVALPYDLAAGMYLCRFAGADGNDTIVRLVYKP